MESKSKRKESYKNQPNLSPERKSSGVKRSSKRRREQSLDYNNSRAEEMNDSGKRKYKGENNNESRQRKDYGFKSHDRSFLKEPSSSHYAKKSIGFNNSRNSRSNEAVYTEINGSVKRNKDESSRNYEIQQHKKYKDYSLKSKDRSLSKDRSPRQKSQFVRKSTDRRNSRSKEAVYKQLNEMLQTEQHHTRYVDRSTSGEVKYVVWCPQYINPDIKGHVRGGTSLLHHRCRQCRKLCFHLLGQPGTTRRCLACSGYKEKYIPDWYYHKRCKYCQ